MGILEEDNRTMKSHSALALDLAIEEQKKSYSEERKLKDIIAEIQNDNDKLKKKIANAPTCDCHTIKSKLYEANRQNEILVNQLTCIKKKMMSGIFI